MKTLITLALCLLPLASLHAQRALQKNPTTGALLEGFKSGSNTLEIDATGTLKFNSGFTLTGGSYLKSALNLDAVENTALSTWTGSTNLATVGTISTGNWQANPVTVTYGGTGATTAADARINLGLVIGTNVQAYNATLSAIAAGTWTGASSITTVGTLSAGAIPTTLLTGTITNAQLAGSIGISKIAITGTPDGTKFLRDDGSWQAISLSGYQTTSGTLALAGFSSITGTLPVANGGTGITSFGTGIATWLGTPTKANFNAAISDDDPAYVGSNNAFTGRQTITSTSATVASPHLKIVGFGGNITCYDDDGTTIRWYTNQGRFFAGDFNDRNQTANLGRDSSGGLGVSTSGVHFVTAGNWYSGTNIGHFAYAAANAVGLKNSTTSCAFHVANTWTSITNFEAFAIDWQTTTNTCRVGTVKGSGGGTARALVLQTDGATRITISATGEIFMVLPTSAGTTGSLWNDSGTVKVAP